jgi:uncharacterized protein (DUF779 family)
MRIAATDGATDAVRRVAQSRTDLVMVLSSGCCDSTAPFLFDHYLPEAGSIPVGEIAGVPVLAPGWLATLYADDQLTVDVVETVDDSFSLETEYDRRFVLRA